MKLALLRPADSAARSEIGGGWPAQQAGRPEWTMPAFTLGVLLCILDTAVLGVAGLATHWAVAEGESWSRGDGWFLLLSVCAAGGLGCFYCDTDPEALLTSAARTGQRLKRSASGFACALLICGVLHSTGVEAAMPHAAWVATYAGAGAALLCVECGTIGQASRLAPYASPLRVALIGGRDAQLSACHRMEGRPWPMHRLVACYDPGAFSTPWPTNSMHRPLVIRTDQELVDQIRAEEIDLILIDAAGLKQSRIDELVAQLLDTPIEMRFVIPDSHAAASSSIAVPGAAVPQFRVRTRPLAGWRGVAKRAEDLAISIPMLLCLAPVMVLIAIVIKLNTPGPVLFRQRRYGENNRAITVLKFRTMRHDRQDAAGAVQATRNDDRVTAVGRLLRRLSLDELPQLFNVLGGSMSVVGPRPHALETRAAGVLFENAVARYAARHNMKPGITGLAQIRGWRGPTETVLQLERRVECDLEYIRDWSVLLDLRIVLETLPSLVRKRNAF